MWRDVANLLCVRLDSLGDVLMTTPAMRAFRETFPGSRLTLLTSPAGAALGGLLPEVDRMIAFKAPWMKPAADNSLQELRFLEQLREGSFDAAVIFTVYSQSALPAAYLCYLAGIPRRLAHCRENPYQLLTDWIADPEPSASVRHEVRRQLDLAAAVGCRTANEHLSFRVPESAVERVAALSLPSPLVLVHPGASAASRRYPPESYSSALDLLGREVVFTGDPAEKALVESVRSRLAVPSRSLAGELSVAELGALIDAADLLICNNTGPAHIAAALGTPVVELYALTNPQHTPWQVESRVLFHEVPCRNCYKSVCPAGHHDCLRGVAPQRVAAAARELLAA
jgi:lipopolysaccharide heptosyltransferase II